MNRFSANWLLYIFFIILFFAPLWGLIYYAADTTGSWDHLLRYVLPRVVGPSFLILSGVGLLTVVIGVVTAWLVIYYDFFGHKLCGILLVLPLAVPLYISTYTYNEITTYTGILQTVARQIFGWQSAQDYWMPEVSGVGGVIFVFSFNLYPYVFITSSIAFALQWSKVIDAAKTLTGSSLSVFKVMLPLARPSIIAGLSIVTFECLTDLGSVSYLGVRTFSTSLYNTWLGRGDPVGAAQIALSLLFICFVLLFIEQYSRRKLGYKSSFVSVSISRTRIKGLKSFGAMLICMFPVLIGFVIPVIYLISSSLYYYEVAHWQEIFSATGYSLFIALIVGLLSVLTALIIVYFKNIKKYTGAKILMLSSGFGYAVPGVVLPLGLFMPFIWLSWLFYHSQLFLFGTGIKVFLMGTFFAVIYGCVIKFSFLAITSLDSAMSKNPTSMHDSGVLLGSSPLTAFLKIDMPVLFPSIMMAFLMVFVDCLKELPITLILKPSSVETLATLIFTYADAQLFGYAAPGALIIIVISSILASLLALISYSKIVGSR